VNHVPKNMSRADFFSSLLETRIDEAARGLVRLRSLFGPDLRPMFVPPWNRVAPDLLPALPGLGFTHLSTVTPRRAPEAAPGLAQVDAHLDPIDWKGSRGLADPDRLIAQIAAQLAERRSGRADASEPYGILTHHLAHDEAIWSFIDTLLARLMRGPVRPWTVPHMETPT